MNTNSSILAQYFDKIYVINLPSRQDRRDEMQAELKKIGLSLTDSSVELFAAVRPTDKGNWPSIGARGCFASHFQILQDAKNNNYANILIIEDDLDFIKDFNDQFKLLSQQIKAINWDIFYGGYELLETSVNLTADKTNLYTEIVAETPIRTTHFIAFNQPVIAKLIDYLQLMMNRPAGDPSGGPMHVDGAYSWFRNANPNVITIIAIPQLGFQRSSRTDIHDLGWKDTMPVLRNIISTLRKLKNVLLSH